MARQPIGLYSAPPMAPLQAAQVQMTPAQALSAYSSFRRGDLQSANSMEPMQAAALQLTPAQALATYSAFRKEADPNIARRLAMVQSMRDNSAPTVSGSILEGVIRAAKGALDTRAYRDANMQDMQDKADVYNAAQTKFDAGVAEKAQAAAQQGAEQGRYAAYGMNRPQPMEVGGRVVDAGNNFRELYAPKQEITPYQQEMLDLRRDQMAQAGARGDGSPQWRPATQEEQTSYGTTQPLLIDDRTGNVKPVPGAGGVMASADQRGRVALSLPNVIQAQNDLAQIESGGRNVFNDQWGARLAEAVPFDGGTIARAMGGSEYQAYDQASRTFEAAIMPIFSGSAVTESEAQRFVRANLPRMGDAPETLAKKSLNRQRIVNGAAELAGQPLPFPKAGSWKATGQQAPAANPAAGSGIDALLDKYAPK